MHRTAVLTVLIPHCSLPKVLSPDDADAKLRSSVAEKLLSRFFVLFFYCIKIVKMSFNTQGMKVLTSGTDFNAKL